MSLYFYLIDGDSKQLSKNQKNKGTRVYGKNHRTSENNTRLMNLKLSRCALDSSFTHVQEDILMNESLCILKT